MGLVQREAWHSKLPICSSDGILIEVDATEHTMFNHDDAGSSADSESSESEDDSSDYSSSDGSHYSGEHQDVQGESDYPDADNNDVVSDGGATRNSVAGKKSSLTPDEILELKNDRQVRKFFFEMVDEGLRRHGTPPPRKEATPDSGRIKQNKVKLPSDTTLYTPALKRQLKSNDAIEKISNFVESMRLQSEESQPGSSVGEQSVTPEPRTDRGRNRQHSQSKSR